MYTEYSRRRHPPVSACGILRMLLARCWPLHVLAFLVAIYALMFIASSLWDSTGLAPDTPVILQNPPVALGGEPIAPSAPGQAVVAEPRQHAQRGDVHVPELPHDRPFIVIPDVHGAYEQLVNLLRELSVVDEELSWAAGTTILVQTGDVVDRGVGARRCLDLLRRLQSEAAKAGGRVITLWGNHEMMQFQGNMRYAANGELAQWGHDTAEYNRGLNTVMDFFFSNASQTRLMQLRGTYYKQFVRRHIGSMSQTHHQKLRRLKKAFPFGSFAHLRLWSPGGEYHEWLTNPTLHPLVVQVNDTICVHGGLNEHYGLRDLHELNAQFFREVAAFTELWQKCVKLGYCLKVLGIQGLVNMASSERRYGGEPFSYLPPDIASVLMSTLQLHDTSIVQSPKAPYWYRGLVWHNTGTPVRKAFDAVLARHSASYMLVGHTVNQHKTVTKHFSGHLLQLDCGMTAAYHGNAVAAIRDSVSSAWRWISLDGAASEASGGR